MKARLFKTLTTLVSLSLVAAACAPAAVPTATQPAAQATSSGGSGKKTATGFECPEPQPRMAVTSKELNLFVWTEYVPQDILDCFNLVYGITVNREEFSSNEEMYAKIKAGGANYDIVQPTDYIVSLMVRQNMLQKFDHSKLPNIGNFDPQYMNLPFDPNNDYTLPYQAGTDAIVYNADKVNPPPTSWKDLWNPAYAGRLISLDDSRIVIGATLISLGYSPNTTDEKQLEEAKVKLKELVANIKLFDSDSPKTAIIAGEVDMGLTWTGEAFLASQENPAIKYVYPSEGAIVWQDNSAIPVGAPHTDAAYAWLNYTAQGNVFWLMLRDFPYTNPNKATLDYAKANQPDLYNTYINSPITNTPPEALKNGKRIDDVGDALTLYDRIWTEVHGGN